MKYFIACCGLLFSLSAAAQTIEEQYEKLNADHQSNKITELQYSKALLEFVKKHYPQDWEGHTLAQYRVFLADELKRKKITPAEFNYKWEEKRNAYMAKAHATQEDEEFRQARQRVAERESADREAQARRAQEQLAAQQANHQAMMEQQLRIEAMQQGLNSFNRGMARNFPAPVNCTSSNSFGVVNTSCR